MNWLRIDFPLVEEFSKLVKISKILRPPRCFLRGYQIVETHEVRRNFSERTFNAISK